MKRSFVAVVLAASILGCRHEPVRTIAAADTFRVHCASCHGANADGNGPAAAALAVRPPDLRTLAKRNGGTFPAERVAAYIDGREMPVSHGTRAMPVWGSVFDATGRLVPGVPGSAQRIESVIDYLRSLQIE